MYHVTLIWHRVLPSTVAAGGYITVDSFYGDIWWISAGIPQSAAVGFDQTDVMAL